MPVIHNASNGVGNDSYTATSNKPQQSIEYGADYQRKLAEIDKDSTRSDAQKQKAKELLSRSALTRFGK